MKEEKSDRPVLLFLLGFVTIFPSECSQMAGSEVGQM